MTIHNFGKIDSCVVKGLRIDFANHRKIKAKDRRQVLSRAKDNYINQNELDIIITNEGQSVDSPVFWIWFVKGNINYKEFNGQSSIAVTIRDYLERVFDLREAGKYVWIDKEDGYYSFSFPMPEHHSKERARANFAPLSILFESDFSIGFGKNGFIYSEFCCNDKITRKMISDDFKIYKQAIQSNHFNYKRKITTTMDFLLAGCGF